MSEYNDTSEISSIHTSEPGPTHPPEATDVENAANAENAVEENNVDTRVSVVPNVNANPNENENIEQKRQKLNKTIKIAEIQEIIEHITNVTMSNNSQQTEPSTNADSTSPVVLQQPSRTENVIHSAIVTDQRYSQLLPETTISIIPLPFQPHVLHGPSPITGAPPSYSAVMRLGPADPVRLNRPVGLQPSPPFIAPIPPPSYGEAYGLQIDRQMVVASLDRLSWGPDPIFVLCPQCGDVVVTSTQVHRSSLTHFTALALCLCGCWPCCLLPYCMNSCKNTYHHCPSCQRFLGVYRPW